jgi:hypothetical protein
MTIQKKEKEEEVMNTTQYKKYGRLIAAAATKMIGCKSIIRNIRKACTALYETRGEVERQRSLSFTIFRTPSAKQ